MGVVKSSIDIDASPKEVWRTVTDLERVGDWVTIHEEFPERPPEKVSKGTTFGRRPEREGGRGVARAAEEARGEVASRGARRGRFTHITPPPFQIFLDAHRREVLSFLIAVAGPNDADDCFQETFIAALRAYGRLRGDSNLRAWVLTIAHRKAIDAARARSRRAVPVDAVPEGAVLDGPVEGEPELWSLVRELPPKQRAAIAHRFVADLSYAEIGPIMGCSEEAARRSVHEGLTKLRGEWDR